MSFKRKLSEATGIEEKLLPSSYQIVGHVLLIKFMKLKNLSWKKKIAASILEILPYVKTVCEITKVKGEFRAPETRKLAGDGTVTVHKEHGILYRLDAAKIMFSKGNLFERQRLIGQVKRNETIVDMFAGIGYFSLGLAKKAKKIIAIEKNPVAFRYLKENIKLNRISNIAPFLADNRKLKLENLADRVIMGYLPRTEKFLPFAVKTLKNKGIIHFHNTYKTDELWRKPVIELKKNLSGLTYSIVDKKKVKSIAPNTYHAVIDIQVKKLNHASRL